MISFFIYEPRGGGREGMRCWVRDGAMHATQTLRNKNHECTYSTS
jgi:hypothetical protein